MPPTAAPAAAPVAAPAAAPALRRMTRQKADDASAREVAAVAVRVREMIRSGHVDPTSCLAIVRAAASVAKSWDTVEAVVYELAKGADGVEGTPDDLIPEGIVRALHIVLDNGWVAELAAWLRDSEAAAKRAGRPWYRCWC
jgi:hypothetical protein